MIVEKVATGKVMAVVGRRRKVWDLGTENETSEEERTHTCSWVQEMSSEDPEQSLPSQTPKSVFLLVWGKQSQYETDTHPQVILIKDGFVGLAGKARSGQQAWNLQGIVAGL